MSKLLLGVALWKLAGAQVCNSDGSHAAMSSKVANGVRTLTSTGCSGYDWSTQDNPNDATVQSFSNTVPTSVEVCKSTAIDQVVYVDKDAMNADNLALTSPVMGMLGYSLDGVSIFGPMDAEDAGDGTTGRNAVIYEGVALGHCGSHTTGGGIFHYHSHPGIQPTSAQCSTSCSPRDSPTCNRKMMLCDEEIPATASVCSELLTGPWACYSLEAQATSSPFGSAAAAAGNHSLLLGFMADGVPLYGFNDAGGNEPTDLDVCGGHTTDLGFYHYHATRKYPYTIKCLRGRMSRDTHGSWRGQLYNMAASCTSGYDTYDYSAIMPNWNYPLTTTPADAPTEAPTDAPPAASTVAPAPTPPSAPSPIGSREPNFLIFQPDDMPFYDDWNPPGNAPGRPNVMRQNPGLTNMARVRTEGLSFSAAYTASPACAPSRFATLTGRYPSRAEYGRTRTLSSDANAKSSYVTVPNSKLDSGDCTNSVPAWLRAKGYRTGVAGKWHLSAGSANLAYAAQQTQITDCGFDWADGIYMENLAGTEDYGHNMEWVTERAIHFINSTSVSQPFFLYFNPTVPHSPGVRDSIDNFDCSKTPSGTLPAEPQVVGMTVGTTCAQYRATLISRSTVGNAKQEDDNLGSLWADDALGALMTTLETRGDLDNTFLVVMMDHGMETKMALFENGNRIALSVRYPPLLAAGHDYPGLVSNLDLAHTILEVSTVEAPTAALDGKSWLAEVQATKTGEASDMWTQRCLFQEYENDRSVRCGCKKLISIGDVGDSTTLTRAGTRGYSEAAVQLYDVCTDSSETTNLATSDSELVASLQEVLDCHLARTAPAGQPDFSTCGNETQDPTQDATPAPIPATTLAPPPSPTSAPMASSPMASPTSAPTDPVSSLSTSAAAQTSSLCMIPLAFIASASAKLA